MDLWQIKNPALYGEIKDSIASTYPSLHVLSENNLIYIRGTLIINIPETDKELDRFSIEIIFPPDYPKRIPILKETDGRFPKIADRHFNANGTACLFFRDGRFKYYPDGSTIIYFIEKLVKNFFVWQIDYDLNNGKSTIGGWGHNVEGIFEFYYEILNTKNPKNVLKFLEYHTSKHLKKHWPCYCGSAKQLRFCHLHNLTDLRSKILRSDALLSLKMINELIKAS